MAREHHWTPHYIDGLYLDDADHFGLVYWYDDLQEMIKEINKPKEK